MTNRKRLEQQSKGSLPKPGSRQTLVVSYDRITLYLCIQVKYLMMETREGNIFHLPRASNFRVLEDIKHKIRWKLEWCKRRIQTSELT